ncbi:MAG: histidinol-phosphatase HisJ family protein [Chloroflexota bacterium]|jgi:histidinol-phosphatase (PHP family)
MLSVVYIRLANSLQTVNSRPLTRQHKLSLINPMINGIKLTTDYHIHSNFSMDGQDSIEAMCRRACALGYSEIAITEHAEWHPAYHGQFNVEAYFTELDRCRALFADQGLLVLSGIELGNPHEYVAQAKQLIQDYPFDIRIASLHWLYGENIHDPACFTGREPTDAFADYFVELGQMAAEFSDANIVGHFDRILWRGTMMGADFALGSLENVIRDALATIAWRGLALELNTRLLGQNPGWHAELVTMLRWYREEGGLQIVVNSDSHRTGHLGTNIELAGQILAKAGLVSTRLQINRSLAVPVN